MALERRPAFLIRLIADEASEVVNLSDLSAFFYDTNLLYELIRLSDDEKYGGYRISQFSLYRNRRKLDTEDQMFVYRLRKESPVEAILGISALVISAATALKLLVDVFEKIWNIPVNRRILLATASRLEGENREHEALPESASRYGSIDRQGSDRDQPPGYYIDRVIRRLEKSPIKMMRVQVKQANLLFENGKIVGEQSEFDFAFDDDE
jgi:hypothetical protein